MVWFGTSRGLVHGAPHGETYRLSDGPLGRDGRTSDVGPCSAWLFRSVSGWTRLEVFKRDLIDQAHRLATSLWNRLATSCISENFYIPE